MRGRILRFCHNDPKQRRCKTKTVTAELILKLPSAVRLGIPLSAGLCISCMIRKTRTTTALPPAKFKASGAWWFLSDQVRRLLQQSSPQRKQSKLQAKELKSVKYEILSNRNCCMGAAVVLTHQPKLGGSTTDGWNFHVQQFSFTHMQCPPWFREVYTDFGVGVWK